MNTCSKEKFSSSDSSKLILGRDCTRNPDDFKAKCAKDNSADKTIYNSVCTECLCG